MSCELGTYLRRHGKSSKFENLVLAVGFGLRIWRVSTGRVFYRCAYAVVDEFVIRYSSTKQQNGTADTMNNIIRFHQPGHYYFKPESNDEPYKTYCFRKKRF